MCVGKIALFGPLDDGLSSVGKVASETWVKDKMVLAVGEITAAGGVAEDIGFDSFVDELSRWTALRQCSREHGSDNGPNAATTAAALAAAAATRDTSAVSRTREASVREH